MMAAPALQRYQGTIEFFNAEKGYGFVKPTDVMQHELFFHVSEVAAEYEPRSGDACEFAVGKDRDGRSKAVAVTLGEAAR